MNNKPTVVIKYGGHAMDDPSLRAPFAESLVQLKNQGMHFVLVHGGGPQINNMLERLQIESRFEQGLRVTCAKTMEAVEMVLCGQVNKAVVTLLQQAGGQAVGICGQDAALFEAQILKPELGFVGQVCKVNMGIVQALLNAGYIPVIAPVATNIHAKNDELTALNINADTAAGALAGALQAEYFVLVSDVPGVLDAQGQLLPQLKRGDIDVLKQNGTISGGMIPKVDSCLHALECGCKKALILDGRAKASLQQYLMEHKPLGTVIEN